MAQLGSELPLRAVVFDHVKRDSHRQLAKRKAPLHSSKSTSKGSIAHTKVARPKQSRIKVPIEPDYADELRTMRAGMLTIRSVLHDVRNVEVVDHDQNKSYWLDLLFLRGASGHLQQEYPNLFAPISATGVSVVAPVNRGTFHTQYYVPRKKEAIRKSTGIPLNLMKPPKPDISADPLWWWESPRYLEILEEVLDAAEHRFEAFQNFLIEREAARAGVAVSEIAQVCLGFVSEWIAEDEHRSANPDRITSTLRILDAPKTALERCSPIFSDYGIDLPKLLRRVGFQTDPRIAKKLGLASAEIEARLLGAAIDHRWPQGDKEKISRR